MMPPFGMFAASARTMPGVGRADRGHRFAVRAHVVGPVHRSLVGRPAWPGSDFLSVVMQPPPRPASNTNAAAVRFIRTYSGRCALVGRRRVSRPCGRGWSINSGVILGSGTPATLNKTGKHGTTGTNGHGRLTVRPSRNPEEGDDQANYGGDDDPGGLRPGRPRPTGTFHTPDNVRTRRRSFPGSGGIPSSGRRPLRTGRIRCRPRPILRRRRGYVVVGGDAGRHGLAPRVFLRTQFSILMQPTTHKFRAGAGISSIIPGQVVRASHSRPVAYRPASADPYLGRHRRTWTPPSRLAGPVVISRWPPSREDTAVSHAGRCASSASSLSAARRCDRPGRGHGQRRGHHGQRTGHGRGPAGGQAAFAARATATPGGRLEPADRRKARPAVPQDERAEGRAGRGREAVRGPGGGPEGDGEDDRRLPEGDRPDRGPGRRRTCG